MGVRKSSFYLFTNSTWTPTLTNIDTNIASIMPSAYRHVWPAACIPGLGYRVHQLTTDAKVTQLDVTLSVH